MKHLLAALVLVLSGSAALADRSRDLVIVNPCESRTWQIMVKHSPRDDVWVKHGWWELAPKSRINPLSDGKRLRHRDNAKLYVFYETVDGRKRVKGDYGISYQGDFFERVEAVRVLRGPDVEYWIASC
ncbi:hypothetical protein SAMN05216376_101533 [Mameliella alba]|uniref:hypothetical protein n=1 Tax=Mameliella alba TaxID=561184 RepID=UPI00088EC7BB|nr:hypothetical protein [Mameliella alba]OWV50015.1 hypothetical protein CDZ96_00490 [Mameliella alba]PTR42608.1 hypothetical protein LX94_00531 [Mameliella alba]GGF72271.1 hypothetical protein GCM10011319_36110 [Mameliella alba]SDC17526.1 hypothetical protein SAMN05216376_101533 [Mameliella alba]